MKEKLPLPKQVRAFLERDRGWSREDLGNWMHQSGAYMNEGCAAAVRIIAALDEHKRSVEEIRRLILYGQDPPKTMLESWLRRNGWKQTGAYWKDPNTGAGVFDYGGLTMDAFAAIAGLDRKTLADQVWAEEPQ